MIDESSRGKKQAVFQTWKSLCKLYRLACLVREIYDQMEKSFEIRIRNISLTEVP